jgi:hypothetical protein
MYESPLLYRKCRQWLKTALINLYLQTSTDQNLSDTTLRLLPFDIRQSTLSVVRVHEPDGRSIALGNIELWGCFLIGWHTTRRVQKGYLVSVRKYFAHWKFKGVKTGRQTWCIFASETTYTVIVHDGI